MYLGDIKVFDKKEKRTGELVAKNYEYNIWPGNSNGMWQWQYGSSCWWSLEEYKKQIEWDYQARKVLERLEGKKNYKGIRILEAVILTRVEIKENPEKKPCFVVEIR